ncbi:hypothetical protein BLOT_007426 [Blomia tropicalis]|nr:hypothetical protein BLOT_007426 [Blomia tropicalis]
MHLRNILFIVKFPTNCGQECFLKHTKPWSIRLSKQKPMLTAGLVHVKPLKWIFIKAFIVLNDYQHYIKDCFVVFIVEPIYLLSVQANPKSNYQLPSDKCFNVVIEYENMQIIVQFVK